MQHYRKVDYMVVIEHCGSFVFTHFCVLSCAFAVVGMAIPWNIPELQAPTTRTMFKMSTVDLIPPSSEPQRLSGDVSVFDISNKDVKSSRDSGKLRSDRLKLPPWLNWVEIPFRVKIMIQNMRSHPYQWT